MSSSVAQAILRFVEKNDVATLLEDRQHVIDEVRELIHSGKSLDAQLEFKLALQSLVPELVEMTLEAGADPNKASPPTNMLPIFSFLGAISTKNSSQPVSSALMTHRQDVVKILEIMTRHGLDWEAKNSIGSNILKLAITLPDEELAMTMIELGAGEKDDVALYNAAHQRMTRVVEALLKKGANPNGDLIDIKSPPIYTAVSARPNGMLQVLYEHGADLHHTSRGGQLPLRMAIENGNMEAVDFILDKQPPNAKQVESVWRGALGIKVFFSNDAKEFTCLERLIERGYSPANFPGLVNELSLLVTDHHAIRFMAHHGILDVHARNDLGQTPLVISMLKPRVQSMNILLAAGADPNTEIPGEPPAHILSIAAHKAIQEKGNSDTYMRMTAALVAAGARTDVPIRQDDAKKKSVSVADALMRLNPQAKSNHEVSQVLQEIQTLIRSIQARDVLRAKIGAIVRP